MPYHSEHVTADSYRDKQLTEIATSPSSAKCVSVNLVIVPISVNFWFNSDDLPAVLR